VLQICCCYNDRAPVIRFNERVYIPQEAHPEIGFIGMIIGPRGNSLRKIEKEVPCYSGIQFIVNIVVVIYVIISVDVLVIIGDVMVSAMCRLEPA